MVKKSGGTVNNFSDLDAEMEKKRLREKGAPLKHTLHGDLTSFLLSASH